MSDTKNIKDIETQKLDIENEKVNNKINLLELEITNENTALNAMIGFLNIAQNRGAFAINESAKIHDCIKIFMKK